MTPLGASERCVLEPQKTKQELLRNFAFRKEPQTEARECIRASGA